MLPTKINVWNAISTFSVLFTLDELHQREDREIEEKRSINRRAATNSHFIIKCNKIKWIANHFDDWLIVSVISEAKISNFFFLFHLLKCKDLKLFFVISDRTWRVFRLLTVLGHKENIWRRHSGLCEIVMSIFQHFSFIYLFNIF